MGNVLIIQNFHVEGPELIESVLHKLGHSTRIVHTCDNQRIPVNSQRYDGLVIMGGPMGVGDHDQFPFILDVLKLIQNFLETDKPILGICLGSQLLAHTLGSTITTAPTKEIGWYPVNLKPAAHDDPLFAGCPAQITPLHWHGDVFNLPRGAIKLASSELTANQAFRYGKGAWGILFHMEITSKSLVSWTSEFSSEIAEVGLDTIDFKVETATYLPALRPIGYSVFSNWAKLIPRGPDSSRG